MLKASATERFRSRFAGRVILPADPGYEGARQVHNGAVQRRPALIARCADADDVCRAVEFARGNQLEAAVRSGGHSQVGHSVCDGGIVIDLSGLKRIDVDPERGVARVQTGALAGELDRATQAFDLATAMGQCLSVGVGGLTTGGGFGWLAGKYGLACDNLVSARVVTADGRRLRAAADDNPDLFWALRGGGGNFGVAVEFEYRLYPLSRVVGGMLWYPESLLSEGLAFMSRFLRDAPDELTVSFGVRPVGRDSCFAVALSWCGDPTRAGRILQPLNSFARPIGGSIGPLPYLAMQSMMGESPSGSRLHTRGGFLRELSDAAIDTIVDLSAGNSCAAKLFWLDRYRGAMCRVAQAASAFPVREPGFGFLVQSELSGPHDADSQIEWVNEAISSMRPFAADIVYVANLGEETPDRVKACYGPNYARLAAVKYMYDPGNFFRLNQNIVPIRP